MQPEPVALSAATPPTVGGPEVMKQIAACTHAVAGAAAGAVLELTPRLGAAEEVADA